MPEYPHVLMYYKHFLKSSFFYYTKIASNMRRFAISPNLGSHPNRVPMSLQNLRYGTELILPGTIVLPELLQYYF